MTADNRYTSCDVRHFPNAVHAVAIHAAEPQPGMNRAGDNAERSDAQGLRS